MNHRRWFYNKYQGTTIGLNTPKGVVPVKVVDVLARDGEESSFAHILFRCQCYITGDVREYPAQGSSLSFVLPEFDRFYLGERKLYRATYQQRHQWKYGLRTEQLIIERLAKDRWERVRATSKVIRMLFNPVTTEGSNHLLAPSVAVIGNKIMSYTKIIGRVDGAENLLYTDCTDMLPLLTKLGITIHDYITDAAKPLKSNLKVRGGGGTRASESINWFDVLGD